MCDLDDKSFKDYFKSIFKNIDTKRIAIEEKEAKKERLSELGKKTIPELFKIIQDLKGKLNDQNANNINGRNDENMKSINHQIIETSIAYVDCQIQSIKFDENENTDFKQKQLKKLISEKASLICGNSPLHASTKEGFVQPTDKKTPVKASAEGGLGQPIGKKTFFKASAGGSFGQTTDKKTPVKASAEKGFGQPIGKQTSVKASAGGNFFKLNGEQTPDKASAGGGFSQPDKVNNNNEGQIHNVPSFFDDIQLRISKNPNKTLQMKLELLLKLQKMFPNIIDEDFNYLFSFLINQTELQKMIHFILKKISQKKKMTIFEKKLWIKIKKNVGKVFSKGSEYCKGKDNYGNEEVDHISKLTLLLFQMFNPDPNPDVKQQKIVKPFELWQDETYGKLLFELCGFSYPKTILDPFIESGAIMVNYDTNKEFFSKGTLVNNRINYAVKAIFWQDLPESTKDGHGFRQGTPAVLSLVECVSVDSPFNASNFPEMLKTQPQQKNMADTVVCMVPDVPEDMGNTVVHKVSEVPEVPENIDNTVVHDFSVDYVETDAEMLLRFGCIV